MKKLMKRLMAFAMVMTLVFTSGAGDLFAMIAKAASPTTNMRFIVASAKEHGVISEYGNNHTGKVWYTIADGHPAYCLNYSYHTKQGDLMSSSGTPLNITLSYEQEKLLAYVLYYGVANDSDADPNDEMKGQYIATQAMVWNVVMGLWGTGLDDSAAKKLCDCAPSPDQSWNYYVAVKGQVQTAWAQLVPSFASKRGSNTPTYELTWNDANGRYEVTLWDSNGVYPTFNTFLQNYEIERNGNSLTVWRSTPDNDGAMAYLYPNNAVVELTGACVYWHNGKPDYQSFISERPTADPLYAYFMVKTSAAGYGFLEKKDAETGTALPGATYGIYSDEGCENLLQTMTTGEDGTCKSGALATGTYYVREITSPAHYVLDETVYAMEVTAGQTTTLTVSDKEQLGAIRIFKEGEVLTGWNGKKFVYEVKKLSGAEFKVTAAEDVYKADGTLAFEAGSVVAENVTTGEDGSAVVADLHLGSYLVVETKGVDGYSVNADPVPVSLTYKDQAVTVQVEDVTVQNERKRAGVTVSKADDETNEPLAGAEFTLYAGDDVTNFAGKVVMHAGDAIQTAVTGEDGKAAFTADLPAFHSYKVKETKAPYNYVLNDADVFEFTFAPTDGSDLATTFSHAFADKVFTARLRIVKADAETKRTVLVPGAGFQVFSKEKNAYVSMAALPGGEATDVFFTDADGDLILPEPLPCGTYVIEEVQSPDGYLLSKEKYEIVISSDAAYETDPVTQEAVFTVTCADKSAKGRIVIEKKGDVLTGATEGENGSFGDFTYEGARLSGVIFEVYAAEDVLSPDCQTDEDGNVILAYAKGDLVATLVTDENGRAASKELPLGRYEVREAKAAEGFVVSAEGITVTLACADGETPVVTEEVSLQNDRAKVKLVILKRDAEDGRPIAGAEFGLYADEDVRAADGSVIVKAGTLLETAVSGADGKVNFAKDYPFGRYFAMELKSPAGYVSTSEKVILNAAYEGQDVSVVTCTAEVKNHPTVFEFSKEDITSGAELSGARLTVLDEAGNMIDEWISKAGEKHAIKGLEVGKSYVLRELYAPYGYLKASDVRFTVMDEATVQGVVMKDEVPRGTILITKEGEFLSSAEIGDGQGVTFGWGTQGMAGVTFEVYAREKVVSPDGLDRVYYEKDQHMGTIVTGADGVGRLENLPLGRYYLIEAETLDGFVLDEAPIEADLSYAGQDAAIVYAGDHLWNERRRVEITAVKKDAVTKECLAGAVIGLYAKEDVRNANGETVLLAGELIEKETTGADGKAIFVADLPLAKFLLREIQAPSGYAASLEEVVIDASAETNEKVIAFEAEFEDFPIKVEFRKTDVSGEQEVPGARLSVIDAEGHLVESWISEREPHVIEKLPKGSYVLREEFSPYGFKIAKDVEFTVAETGEIQKVAMKDDYVRGRIIIVKKDAEDGSKMEGVDFELRLSDGTLFAKGTTGKDGTLVFENLPICHYENGAFREHFKYYVVETKTKPGYLLDATPREVVLSYYGTAPEVVEYVLEVTNEPTDEKLTQTGGPGSAWFLIFLAPAACMIGGAFVLLRKGNKKGN
jgi:uncharacterized surface anchored protein